MSLRGCGLAGQIHPACQQLAGIAAPRLVVFFWSIAPPAFPAYLRAAPASVLHSLAQSVVVILLTPACLPFACLPAEQRWAEEALSLDFLELDRIQTDEKWNSHGKELSGHSAEWQGRSGDGLRICWCSTWPVGSLGIIGIMRLQWRVAGLNQAGCWALAARGWHLGMWGLRGLLGLPICLGMPVA